MGVRKVAVSVGMAFALAAAFGLAGCGSGQHEVIDQGQDCSSCHSGGKQVFDDAAPASAVQSNGTVSVKTSADQVLVCKPIFVSEDGSKFVPERVSSVKAEDGSAQVQLSEGTWALCTQAQGSVKAQLVTVSSESTGAADVEL